MDTFNDEFYNEMRDRIFTLLKERRISQKELARRIQVSPQTITDWKKGNSHSFASMIGTLSIALNTTPGWLSSGQGQKDMSEVQREEKAEGFLKASMDASRRLEEIAREEFKQNIKRMMQRNNLKASDFADPSIKAIASFLGLSASDLLDQVTPSSICVPVLGTIPAGIPLEAIEDIQDWEEVPASWADGGREYFGLQVKGDSMYPQYLEGDTVILRKSTTCDSGDDCAVLVNGDEATLKRVFLHEDGAIELRPVNAAYPPRTYSPAEVESLPVQIIGVVVELRRKIK